MTRQTNQTTNRITLSEIGEHGFLQRMRQAMCRSDSLIGDLNDDTAMFKQGRRLFGLLTTDMLVEDTHFTIKDTPPESLGYKAVAVNVSDIAAMAGTPKWMTVGLGAPPTTLMNSLDAIYRGIDRACRQYDVTLAGGDTVRAERLTLCVTLTGEYRGRKCQAPLRSRMKPGDWIYATGTLGDSAAGLMLLLEPERGQNLRQEDCKALIHRHLEPTPRVAEALALHASLKRMAMMDLSDDLLCSLRMLAELSGTGFTVNLDDLPHSDALLRFAESLGNPAGDLALLGGEDFELLFACGEKPKQVRIILREAGIKTQATPIARATQSDEIFLRQGREISVNRKTYSHF